VQLLKDGNYNTTMGERNNTVVCCFDPRSPRINAFQIHEWIYEWLQIPEENIRMIQIDGFKRNVYIKFTEEEGINNVLQATGGHMDFKHDNGKITQVIIEIAGMGLKKVRTANLPPETKEYDIINGLSKYGEVRSIWDEMWEPMYRYKVYNGIKIAEMMLKLYKEGVILERQLQGLIVCIPKHHQPTGFDDYRSLTLMNMDYKIMTRILATRLKTYLAEILNQNQYCGVQKNTVFEAVAAVRDVIAHAEVTKKPLCVVSIDFSAAFDRISHDYLRKVLAPNVSSDSVIKRLMSLYDEASSEILINGFKSRRNPTRSVREGCPLSMILFSLCLNPLIQQIDRNISGTKIGRRQSRTAITSYVDDVTIFLTRVEDIQVGTHSKWI